MARHGKPPVVAAKLWATEQIIEEYADEFAAYQETYLAEHGWEQKSETVTRWVNNSEATASEGD